MVSPVTYYGYNNDGDCVAHGTAQDATQYLDPNQVKAAIENIRQVLTEQVSGVARSLTKVSEDASTAVVVKGTKMSGTIDDTNQIIMSLPEQLLAGIEDLYQASVQARDAIQQQLNQQMRNSVASYSGVVRVNP